MLKRFLNTWVALMFATAAVAQTYPSPTYKDVTIQQNLNLPSKNANEVFIAPDGVSGAPTFRTLIPNDIPGLPASKITSGTFDTARFPTTVMFTDTVQSVTGAKTFNAATSTDLVDNSAETRVETLNSNAAASGTSYSTIQIAKGGVYGGQVSGYITQGGDAGLVLRSLAAGVPTELMKLSSNGTVTAPTAASDTNNTEIATTQWVKRERSSLNSIASAQASTIPASLKSIYIQFRDTNRRANSGAQYTRISLADLTGYPASSFFRSTDRFMPDGTTDNTNGGYWLIEDATPDPMQFGAVCDGTTNDRSPIVDAGVYANLKAQAAGGGGGGVVEFSCGIGHFWSSNITLPNGLSWHSRVQTVMKYNGAGAAVTLFGNNGTIDGFRFEYTGTFGTNIVAIQIGVAELAQRQVVRNNVFNNFGTTIYHKAAVGATINGNIINNSSLYGILFENTVNPDAGDAAVFNNIISNSGLAPGTGTAGFRYHSGGGLRFQFNKILSFQRGFDMQIPDGASTVDLMFTGNSIENQSIAGMRLGRSGTTGSFGSLTISGNEIAGTVQCMALNVGAFNGVIIGNAFNLCSQAAIVINADVTNWQIEHNNYAASGANIIDTRADSASEHLADVLRSPVNVTSTTTYTYYSSVAVPAFRSVKARIFVEGILQGAGFVSRNYDIILSHNGTTLVLTQISNTTGTGSVALDLDVDLTTTAGTARIGFRRNAAAGGSGTFNGAYSVNIEGRIGTLIRLQ